MKQVKTAKRLIIVIAAMGLLMACNKEDSSTTAPTNNSGINTPKPNWTDSIVRAWEVVKATHNGTPDNSTEGLELNLKKDGTYLLVTTGFNGTWKFSDSAYKTVLIDEKTPQYKTVWTIKKLTSKRLEIDFKSPFTGGAVHWDLNAK